MTVKGQLIVPRSIEKKISRPANSIMQTWNSTSACEMIGCSFLRPFFFFKKGKKSIDQCRAPFAARALHPTPTPVVRHGYSLAFDLYDLCVARISASLETRCCYMVQEQDFTGSFQHLTPCNKKVMRLVRVPKQRSWKMRVMEKTLNIQTYIVRLLYVLYSVGENLALG